MNDKTTPAPAVEPNAPVVEAPKPRPEVDLSDLQAELDADKRKADEDKIYDDINDTGKPKDGEESEAEEDEEDAEDAAEEEADESEEGDDTDAEAEKPKKRSRVQRYRDRLTRLEQENALLRSRPDGGSLSKAQIAEHVEKIIGREPQESDFDDFLSYEREHTAWILDRRQATRATEQTIAAAHKERADRMADNVEKHNDRVEQFRARNGAESEKDYDAVMSKAKDLRVAPAVEELILESPNSAHLQYFFARNPNRLDKINRMTERDAAREVGHIEARLSLPQPKTKTAAPPPRSAPKGGIAPTSQEAELNSWLIKKYGNR